ncbi:hypothetical protein D3C76_1228810 [compost metagenome]
MSAIEFVIGELLIRRTRDAVLPRTASLRTREIQADNVTRLVVGIAILSVVVEEQPGTELRGFTERFRKDTWEGVSDPHIGGNSEEI